MEEMTKLFSDIIQGLAKDTASAIAKRAKDYFVDMSTKEQIDVGDAYEVYLRKVYDTYSKSKSLVYGSEARELSSFFEPVDLRAIHSLFRVSIFASGLGRNLPDDVVSSNDLAGLFNKGTKIVVTGIGGAGKTILMKHFCLRSIDIMHKIPVFISLRWFNTWTIDDKEKREEPFEKLVFEQLKVFDFKLPYNYFLYSLEGNRYIFLFDGFDEIAGDRKAILLQKLSNFTNKYKGNYFIISSRYNESIIGLDEYRLFEICPLSFEQVKGLTNKLEFDQNITKRFIDDLSNGLYDKYKSFVSIPLLLSILFITYVEKTTIPDSLNEFYEEAFETLLYRHDRRKVGLQRALDSGLSYENFKKLFMRFCYDSYFDDLYSFKESKLVSTISESVKRLDMEVDSHKYMNDLTEIACMIIKDGNEYVFIHRNFQEYYAALFVSKGSDNQQRQLYRRMAEAEEKVNHLGSTRDVLRRTIDIKVFDFLGTLYSIEPKRFEQVFIVPILEKLHSFYIMNNNNIIATVKALFGPDNTEINYRDIFQESQLMVRYDIILLSMYICEVIPSKPLKAELGLDVGIQFNVMRASIFRTKHFYIMVERMNPGRTYFSPEENQSYFRFARAIVQQALFLYQDIKQKEIKYSSANGIKDIF